jgi:group I intron endonuclease
MKYDETTGGDIYGIRCTVTGRLYIGSTVDVARRFYLHRRDLKLGKHHSPKLQNAWNKYGADAFAFEILERVGDVLFLVAREQFWIWRNEAIMLNCSPTAGSPLGVRRTDEQKARMRAIKVAFYSTPEGKWHLTRMQAANKGRKRTPEQRANLSAALKGKKLGREWTEQARAEHSLVMAGRKMPPVSDETKRRISEALVGKKLTAQCIQASIESRTEFIAKELPFWRSLMNEGKSIREIERITGRARKIIARELKAVA